MAYHVQRSRRAQEQLAAAPKEVLDDFEELLRALVEYPRPGEAALGVLPLQEGQKNSEFTAPFDDALLVYRIMPWVDYRVIRLINVVRL